MSPLRNVLVVAVLSASAAWAVACAAPPANKTMVVECDAKENADSEDCEGKDSKDSTSKRSSSGPSTSPDEDRDPTPSAPAPTKTADAGADSGSSNPGTLGFLCGKLDACCKALAKKGITGSANQCASVVSGKNEFACDATFQTFRQPDENYDPPTECQ